MIRCKRLTGGAGATWCGKYETLNGLYSVTWLSLSRTGDGLPSHQATEYRTLGVFAIYRSDMPNRILKETICTSDNLDHLSTDAESFFYRLLVQCDDYGRMDARPPILLSRCFPLRLDRVTTAMVSHWLDQLRHAELITLYSVNGKPYLQFNTWDKHQQVRAKRSKFPASDEGLIADDSNCDQLIANVPVIQSNPIQSESSAGKQHTDKETCPSEWMTVLYQVTQTDQAVATTAQRSNLSACGKALIKGGATLDQLQTFARNWQSFDWRGKKGQPPTAKQIRDEWGKYSKPQNGHTIPDEVIPELDYKMGYDALGRPVKLPLDFRP